MAKALLFLNGEPPKKFPNISDYQVIACTDGAFHYLKQKNFPLKSLDFISGDFDSHFLSDAGIYREKFIETPDQNKTDFEKALEILLEKGARSVDIFGGNGKEMDHFLGNLSVALRFKEKLKLRFFDEFSEYFFAEKNQILCDVKGKMISLYPFPKAENIFTNGLNWELSGEDLKMDERIGTRNFALKDEVSLKFSAGNLLVFIGGIYKV